MSFSRKLLRAFSFQSVRLSAVALILTAASARADDLFLSQNARTFDTQQSSLITKGLGNACLAVAGIPDSLPCNSGMLPLYDRPKLGVQALISNGYSTLDKIRKLLNGNLNQDTVNALFGKDHILQIEGNAEIDFISKYFSARYTPETVRYFSVIRNEANPEVEISAVEEKNFVVQGAYPVNDLLTLGLQAKSYSRRFVKERFQLIDLATDAGKNALKPKTQHGIFFEPTATLNLPGSLKPRLVLAVANVGSEDGDVDRLNEPAEVQAGGAVTVPIGWADVQMDLDYKSLSYNESWNQKFHLGGVLRFGTMWLSGGLDYYGMSGGVFYGLEQVNAGILFTSTQVPWNSNDYYANTVYLQIGWQI